MEIEDLLTPETVIASFKGTSKKQTLLKLSGALARTAELDARLCFDALLEREQLGSTGVGNGVAIPHARVDGIDKVIGLFARLETPVDFDSVDDMPVDLIFMMFAPLDAGADHLKSLARVSRLLRNQKMCEKLRATTDKTALYAMLAQPASNVA